MTMMKIEDLPDHIRELIEEYDVPSENLSTMLISLALVGDVGTPEKMLFIKAASFIDYLQEVAFALAEDDEKKMQDAAESVSKEHFGDDGYFVKKVTSLAEFLADAIKSGELTKVTSNDINWKEIN